MLGWLTPQREASESGTGGGLTVDAMDSCVVEAVLRAGSRTYSHTVILLERYLPLLQTVKASVLLHGTSSVWRRSAQHLVLTFDRLMALRLVSNLDITEWVFTSSQGFAGAELEPHVWEVLVGVSNKTVARAQDYERDASAIRLEATAADRDAAAAEERAGQIAAQVSVQEPGLAHAAEQAARHAESIRNVAEMRAKDAEAAGESYVSARREKYEFFKAMIGHFRSFLGAKLEGLPAGSETPQLLWVLSHLRCITRKYRCDVRRVVLGHPGAGAADGGTPSKVSMAGGVEGGAPDAEMAVEGGEIVIDFDLNETDQRIQDAVYEGIGAALFA